MSDNRMKKSSDPDREPRELSDRAVTEDRELTDEARLEMFRAQLFNDMLPNLPKIPGYHVCWCTTTNPSDSIAGRLRLGYTPVKPEDVPGWESTSLKTGEYAGMIGVNEMVAMKLPERLFKAYMQESHHNRPRQEEERLRDAAERIKQSAMEQGLKAPDVEAGDGFTDLRKPPPRPQFEV